MTDSKTFNPTESTVLAAPDTKIDVRETFGVDIDWQVPAFSKTSACPIATTAMCSIRTRRWRS